MMNINSAGIYRGHSCPNIGFNMPKSNLLVLDEKIVVAGLVPNAGKALTAQNLKPDIAIVHERRNLNEIFFPCAISSAQQKTPVTVVVPNQEIRRAVEEYVQIAYRPFAKGLDPYAPFELDTNQIQRTGIPAQQQEELIAEIEYYDPRCERNLGELINVLIVGEGMSQEVSIKGSPVRVENLGDGLYRFNNNEIDVKDFKEVKFEFGEVPSLSDWHTRFGLFMLGVNSGGSPMGFSAALLNRQTVFAAYNQLPGSDYNYVIDCGAQIPQVLRLAGFSGFDLIRSNWIVTHTHPDHDAGLFELLADPEISQLKIYTHPFAAETIYRKAQILGLRDEALDKIPFLQKAPFDWEKFVQDKRFNLAPNVSDRVGYAEGIETEWTLHGIPTLMLYKDYSTRRRGVRASLIYTADGAFSEDRLGEIRSAGSLSPEREARIKSFINRKAGKTVLIEEIGMGGNHSTRPMDLSFNADYRRFIHWANPGILPPESIAQTFEMINLLR